MDDIKEANPLFTSKVGRFNTWFEKAGWKLSFLFFSIFLLRLIFVVYIDCDEYEGIQTSWLMLQGQVIYSDFFQHHHPLSYFLYFPIISFLGEDPFIVFGCRMISYVFMIGIIFLVVRIIYKIFSSNECAIFSAFLLLICAGFYVPGLQVRPDGSMMFFTLLSFDQLILKKGQIATSRKKLILSGVFMGVAFGFLQKAVFFIAPTAIFLFLQHGWKKFNLRSSLLFVTGVASIALPLVFLFSFQSNGFDHYLFLNWILNKALLQRHGFSSAFSFSLTTSPLLYVFGFIGFSFAVSAKKQPIALRLIAINTLLFLVFILFIANAIWIQYFFPLAIFFSILTPVILLPLLKNSRHSIYLASLILFIFLPYRVLINTFFDKDLISPTNQHIIDRTNFIFNNTTSDDLILDGMPYLSLFRYSPAPYYWWSRGPNGMVESIYTLKKKKYDPYAVIRSKKPLIVDNSALLKLDLKNPVFSDYVLLPSLNILIRNELYSDLLIKSNNPKKGN